MSSLKLKVRIVGIAGLVVVVILAFFYRTEATGFTFAMGNGFNLTIDSHAIYNGVVQDGTNGTYDSTWAKKDLVAGSDKFFNLKDVKPGDHGEATISIHVNKESWICLDFEKLKEYENGENEPEGLEDTGPASEGELADGTEFFAWYDDGDDVFEFGEKPIFGTSTDKQAATKVLKNKTYVLADSLAGTAFPAYQTKYIGITWCAGNLTVVTTNPVSVNCDGAALGNVAQTDSFSVDIGFRAVPKSEKANFKCEKNGLQCDRSGCNGKCGGNVNININNNGTIINNTSSNSNTGGNSAGGGGSVTTGNATSNSNTTNILNQIRILIRR